jgi:two-component system, NarL family, response regulator DevR
VASGHTLIDPEATAHVVQQVALNRRAAHSIADLTPQQTKVLFLIAEGLTNRQIAERLVLAEKTVKNHVTALLHRLGVTHRTQAALVALRLGEEAQAGAVPQPRRGEETPDALPAAPIQTHRPREGRPRAASRVSPSQGTDRLPFAS